MGPDGVFRASKIQAKCASKYEAKPGQKPGIGAPGRDLEGATWRIWVLFPF